MHQEQQRDLQETIQCELELFFPNAVAWVEVTERDESVVIKTWALTPEKNDERTVSVPKAPSGEMLEAWRREMEGGGR